MFLFYSIIQRHAASEEQKRIILAHVETRRFEAQKSLYGRHDFDVRLSYLRRMTIMLFCLKTTYDAFLLFHLQASQFFFCVQEDQPNFSSILTFIFRKMTRVIKHAWTFLFYLHFSGLFTFYSQTRSIFGNFYSPSIWLCYLWDKCCSWYCVTMILKFSKTPAFVITSMRTWSQPNMFVDTNVLCTYRVWKCYDYLERH
jgi:hypothetical protein